MRKNAMLAVACCLMVAVLACALLMPGISAQERVLLLALLVVTGCVYMLCESRVLRAYAPLVICEEPAEQEKAKPPERGCK